MRKITNAELQRPNADSFRNTRKLQVVVVLDNVRSALNVGSVFRTADAFAIEKIILCGITAQPPHREIEKSALGATESVSWEYFTSTGNALVALKEEGFKIVGIEQLHKGMFLDEFKPSANERYAFVFGNEVNGLSDDILNLLDTGIEIPQFGTKHSFNVSVTTGIVLWDYYSKCK
jgi:23S rRNA (guanosine2251-2'-O)-methyltransferase